MQRAVGPSAVVPAGRAHARAHTRRCLAGDECDNWTGAGECARASERASERGERPRERGRWEEWEGRGEEREDEEAEESGEERRGTRRERRAEAGSRGEEPSGEGAGGPARALLRRCASPAATVYYFRALPQLRAPLHNKIYFKTQLKETGRLHVTV